MGRRNVGTSGNGRISFSSFSMPAPLENVSDLCAMLVETVCQKILLSSANPLRGKDGSRLEERAVQR